MGGSNPSRWYSDSVAWIALFFATLVVVGGQILPPLPCVGSSDDDDDEVPTAWEGLNVGSFPVRERRPRADGFGFDGQFTRFGEVGRG